MELSLLSRGILTRLADPFFWNCPETAGKSLAAGRVEHPQPRPPMRKDFQGGLPFRIWFFQRWGRFSLALLLGTKGRTKGTDWTFSAGWAHPSSFRGARGFSRRAPPAFQFRFSNFASLHEDVFDFVEDGGIAVSGLVFHFHRGAKLLDQFALVARKLRGRHHSHMVVQIASPAAARISQPFAFETKHGAALRAFGNLQPLFPVQSRHLQFRTESRLRDAHGDGAIQVRAAPFEVRMLFDLEHDVQIARRPAVRRGLAFAGDPQTCSGIHAGRSPQLNGLCALKPPLPPALRATLLHNLPGALARRSRARDGEESLLIGQLTAACARLAGLNASALFRARAVAGLAVFLPRQLDLGSNSRGGFFERPP